MGLTLATIAIDQPTIAEAWRILTLRAGFNTAVVTAGTTLLGVAAGVCGTFAFLRRRALMGDALAHATLPGIALAFIVATALGGEGKSVFVLLLGAAITGTLGVAAVHALVRHSRVREDAAIAIVLGVFFGVGVTLMSVIQTMSTGTQAGLHHFIYGHTASMLQRDAVVLGVLALVSVAAAAALFKEFRVVCFDDAFASVQGWPVGVLDTLMMTLVVLITVIGLQSVGILLVIALLIIPAVAARFWTDRLGTMTVLAGLFGGASGWIGSTTSALVDDAPAGAVIVLVAGGIFVVSLLAAPSRGVVATALMRGVLRWRVARQHLLRRLYERLETDGDMTAAVAREELVAAGGVAGAADRMILRRLRRAGFVRGSDDGIAATREGLDEAARVTRNHRLWEAYLVEYAHLAPSHVHRAADMVEHVISHDMVRELEAALEAQGRLPESVHALEGKT